MAFLTKSRGGKGGCESGCGSLILIIIVIGVIGGLFSDSSDQSSAGDSPDDLRYVHQATNVRAGQSTDREIVTTLSRGDSVRIGSRTGNWYEVYPGDADRKTSRNHIGYIYESLLQPRRPSSSRQTSGFDPDAEAVGAWTVCEDFVEDRLRAPSTADFPCCYSDFTQYLGDRVFQVRSYVDAENAFGANIRNHFTCRVEYRGNNRWRLQDLQIFE